MSKPKHAKPARKPDPPQSAKPDQAASLKSAPQPSAKKKTEAAASPDAFSVRAATPANTPSIDFQTIAMAYSDYTRKSFEQTKSFVEQLSGVRTLDKAIEIQTEFAKQAYETFVSESQKISELYSGLAKQTFEGAVAKVTPPSR